jgi:hypothetical protein
MESARKDYQPIELDELGEPRWVIPIPLKPSFSVQANPLPFLHPTLKIARPPHWPVPGILPFITDLTINASLELLAELVLARLNRFRLFPDTAGICAVLQRVAFWAATRYRRWELDWDWEYDSIKAPVVFPGEATAMPLDAGLVEPVLVLYALGVQVSSCYDGYGVTLAGIRLKAGFEIPRSLLDALDEAGTGYFHICGDEQTRRELVADSVDSDFTSVLRRWARKVWLDVVPKSPD